MPDNISKLLASADYLSVLTMYGIAALFGSLGGFCGSTVVLIKIGGLTKWTRCLGLVLGLTIAGAFCSLMVFTALMSYEVFWEHQIIEDIETVFHASVFTGFFTSVAMMIANKGISKVNIRFGNSSVNVEMNQEEKK
ncbi:MAG: hypothetical protein KAR40_11230 [Candidatus Sabulitectum sp.]|nr:hypothetical protein [Candidatus Sabulitectum sp.]